MKPKHRLNWLIRRILNRAEAVLKALLVLGVTALLQFQWFSLHQQLCIPREDITFANVYSIFFKNAPIARSVLNQLMTSVNAEFVSLLIYSEDNTYLQSVYLISNDEFSGVDANTTSAELAKYFPEQLPIDQRTPEYLDQYIQHQRDRCFFRTLDTARKNSQFWLQMKDSGISRTVTCPVFLLPSQGSELLGYIRVDTNGNSAAPDNYLITSTSNVASSFAEKITLGTR